MRLRLIRNYQRGITAAAVLFLHTILLAWSAYVHSPVMSEVGHLPAGISHWEFGRFDLYRVNPPLVRMIAALPVMCMSHETNWRHYGNDPLTRDEMPVGIDFVNANAERSFWLYTVARWACTPFSLLGGVVCFLWAKELYGYASGLVALALWCFCPNILGNAALVMPDVPAASLAVASSYLFWRWLKAPTWWKAVGVGVILGLAELTKTTLLVLYPIFLGFALMHRAPIKMLAVQFLVSLYVLNLGYAFEGSFRSLHDFEFQSNALNGLSLPIPVPLPANYVQGIDAQRLDFERGKPSYLAGEWSKRGWWYFYLYCLAIKVPLGTWALAGVAGYVSIHKRCKDEWLLLTPALATLTLISSQTGFSIHFRYVLPVLPFVFILISKAASYRGLTVLCVSWSIGSSIIYAPHSISYFNELVGPENGPRYLLDSGSAWGQDLLFLKKWCDENPSARPFFLASPGIVDPRLAGIEFNIPMGREAGWYAIDANYLHESQHPICDGFGGLVAAPDLTDFLEREPDAKAGYSVYIYHITEKTCSRK